MYKVSLLLDFNTKVISRDFIASEKRLHELVGQQFLKYGAPVEFVSGAGEHTLDFYMEDRDGNYKSYIMAYSKLNSDSKTPIADLPITKYEPKVTRNVIPMTPPPPPEDNVQILSMAEAGILTKVN